MLNQIFVSIAAGYKTPLVISAAALALLVGFFIFRLVKSREGYWLPKKWSRVALVVITISKVLYAALLSALQYFAWKNDTGIGSYFLPPHQSWNYFTSYVLLHFFYGSLLSIASAAVFYLLLKAVAKYRSDIFEEGEAELGALGALIAGWPGAIIYIALSFVILIILSAIRNLFLKEPYTTITWPLIISLVITFFLAAKIIGALNLSVLII